MEMHQREAGAVCSIFHCVLLVILALVPAPLVLWSSAADSVMELLRCICLFARIREPNSLLSLGVEVCLGLGKVHETTSEGAVAANSDNRLKLAQRACC